MKYAPKKVFVLDNGSYTELSYEKFCSHKENDVSYVDKFFIPLHGMLMEVTEETYRDFYKAGLVRNILMNALFFRKLSEREWSAETGIPQKTINDRKRRILIKLKKLLES